MPRNARQDRVTVGNLRKMTPGIILVPEKVLKDPILSKWINIKNHHLLRVFVKGGAFLRFSEGDTPARGKLLKAGVAKVNAVAKGADTPAVKAQVDITNTNSAHPVILRLKAKTAGVAGNQITVKVAHNADTATTQDRIVTITQGSTIETYSIPNHAGLNSSLLRGRFSTSALVDAITSNTGGETGIAPGLNPFRRFGLTVGDYALSGGAGIIPGAPAEPEIPAIPAVYADPIPRSLPPADAKIATDTSEDTVYVNSGAAGSTVAHTILCKADYVRIVKEGRADEVKRLELS